MRSSQRRSLALHPDGGHAFLERHYAGGMDAPGSQPSARQTAEQRCTTRASEHGGQGPLEVGRHTAARTSCPRCARGCACGAHIRVRPVATTRGERSADSGECDV
jgi:hypothetical protein